MLSKLWNNRAVQRFIYFFPFQLLLVTVKKNLQLVLFWAFLFGFATGGFGRDYGVPYLFWDPEYLGRIDFWSFLILGFGCGGFIMAFHISSYISNAHRFPFLATLSKPFFKYSLNNSIIPTVFVGVYSYYIYTFQSNSELFEVEAGLDRTQQIVYYLLGFYTGILIFLFPGYSTLAAISRDVMNMFGLRPAKRKRERSRTRTSRTSLKRNMEWKTEKEHQSEHYDWKVTTYMVHWLRIGLTREAQHYDRTVLKRVFEQNHLIAAIFEILILITFIVLGIYRERELLAIPTGATIFLVFSMLLMFSSAIYSRLRGWSGAVIILLLVVMHFFSKQDIAGQMSKAYGMNYDTIPATYSISNMNTLRNDVEALNSDIENHIEILLKWKQKNTEKRWQKPRMVLICAPGGGQRSALWAFRVAQYADSLTNGELLNHTHLITGASGGMFGMAHFRELKLRKTNGDSIDLYSISHADDVAKDLLNPISTTLALNDLFIRWQTFKDGNNTYTKDRGFSLERQWNLNTNGMTNKRLKDYTFPEANSQIPIMVFSPNILADGRSLYISSQPNSFLIDPRSDIPGFEQHNSAIEFSRFFKHQGADDLWFTTALRMNATFPYISPAVTLPSDPQIEVMDAGFRDTYGTGTALHYLFTFRNWIASNTSGVLIIQIRDRSKVEPVKDRGSRTVIDQVFDPLGGIYNNLFQMQDYQHDMQMAYATKWFDGQLDVVDIEMHRPKVDDIALSWHLTLREKQIIKNAIYLPKNQKAFNRIDSLLMD